MELEVDFTFSAAHRLPYYEGPCKRTHGHNYKLRVTVAGKPDPKSGMILDFEEIRRAVTEGVLGRIDHQNLNDFHDNPTAENMVVWIWERLHGKLPGLTQVRLWENDSYSVAYRGD